MRKQGNETRSMNIKIVSSYNFSDVYNRLTALLEALAVGINEI